MRVISGFLKGKSIDYVKNSKTRPLKDIVKENIFNILIHSNLMNVNIQNSNVLDLYSGVGSFGIECISRGAKNVTFIEKDIISSNILKNNLEKLLVIKKSKIFNESIETFFKKDIKEKFNIFFFDPPFADKKFLENLQLIKKNKLFQSKHIIIIHREIKTEDSLQNFINIIETRKYGRSKLIFGSIN